MLIRMRSNIALFSSLVNTTRQSSFGILNGQFAQPASRCFNSQPSWQRLHSGFSVSFATDVDLPTVAPPSEASKILQKQTKTASKEKRTKKLESKLSKKSKNPGQEQKSDLIASGSVSFTEPSTDLSGEQDNAAVETLVSVQHLSHKDGNQAFENTQNEITKLKKHTAAFQSHRKQIVVSNHADELGASQTPHEISKYGSNLITTEPLKTPRISFPIHPIVHKVEPSKRPISASKTPTGSVNRQWASKTANQPSESTRNVSLTTVQGKSALPTRKKEIWQIQKEALKKKFGSEGWSPRKKLSPDTIVGIRALHEQYRDQYTTPVLAQKFQVSPEAIRRILKSKWDPGPEKMADRRERWAKRHDRIWDQQAAIGLRQARTRDKEAGKDLEGFMDIVHDRGSFSAS